MVQPHRAGQGQEIGSNITATNKIRPKSSGTVISSAAARRLYINRRKGEEGDNQALGLIPFRFGCSGSRDSMEFKSILQAQKIPDGRPRKSWSWRAFYGFSLYISVSRIFKINFIYLSIYLSSIYLFFFFLFLNFLTSAGGAALHLRSHYPWPKEISPFPFPQ